ncbi:hypothetical protein BTVI_152154 [Pitangus sulphuratus]|nr:hypothetical protein BTVI_152154 [Pitangus sulphuratus]
MTVDTKARRDWESRMEEREYLDQPNKRIKGLAASASRFPDTPIPPFPFVIQGNPATSITLNSKQLHLKITLFCVGHLLNQLEKKAVPDPCLNFAIDS